MSVQFASGMRLTPARLNAPIPRIVRKTTDETIISNSTYQNDDALVISVVANATYTGHLHIVYNSGTAPDFKVVGTVPSGTTTPFWTWHAAPAPGQATSLTTGAFFDGTAGNAPFDAYGLVITGGTAGNVQIQWAQTTLTASNTIVRAGSYISLTRVD